jgi:hypothetical protein
MKLILARTASMPSSGGKPLVSFGDMYKSGVNMDTLHSHAHWDHTGDMSTFGGATDLVVGRGFQDHFLGGDGKDSALGGILKSDYE